MKFFTPEVAIVVAALAALFIFGCMIIVVNLTEPPPDNDSDDTGYQVQIYDDLVDSGHNPA